MAILQLLSVALFGWNLQSSQAFLAPSPLPNAPVSTILHATSTTSTSTKTTLTDETKWTIRMFLGSIKTTQGYRADDELVSIPVKFIEEEGYEPPQGRVEIVSSTTDDSAAPATRWKFTKTYWKLSEDPNERKDGLWVWGLFQEPLYPFLLLQMETDEIPLPSPSTQSDVSSSATAAKADSIPPMQLYAQINHKRDANLGVVLEGSYPLKIRTLETFKADPFGAATVEINKDVEIGTIRIEPAAVRR